MYQAMPRVASRLHAGNPIRLTLRYRPSQVSQNSTAAFTGLPCRRSRIRTWRCGAKEPHRRPAGVERTRPPLATAGTRLRRRSRDALWPLEQTRGLSPVHFEHGSSGQHQRHPMTPTRLVGSDRTDRDVRGARMAADSAKAATRSRSRSDSSCFPRALASGWREVKPRRRTDFEDTRSTCHRRGVRASRQEQPERIALVSEWTDDFDTLGAATAAGGRGGQPGVGDRGARLAVRPPVPESGGTLWLQCSSRSRRWGGRLAPRGGGRSRITSWSSCCWHITGYWTSTSTPGQAQGACGPAPRGALRRSLAG